MATQQREVKDFHQVKMQDFGVLEITQGEQESLIVEADEECLDKIYTKVRDGTLILRVGRSWLERLQAGFHTSLSRPPIRYRVTVKDLSAVLVAGFGRVHVGELATEHLALNLRRWGRLSRVVDCRAL